MNKSVTRAFFVFLKIKLLLITLVLFHVSNSFPSSSIPSEKSQEIKVFFSQVDAIINKVSKNEITINKGTKDNIKIGDYFQILKKGKIITNPLTNEILGHQRENQAVIFIKEVYNDYAVGEVIKGEGPFYPGQHLIRFKGIDSYFYQKNDPLESYIKELLPNLNWTQNDTTSLLKFTRNDQKLIVYNHKNEVLVEFSINLSETSITPTKYPTSFKNIQDLNIKPHIHHLITIDDNIYDFLLLNSTLLFLTNNGLFSLQLNENNIKKILSIDKYISPVSIFKNDNNHYIIINTLLNDSIHKTYILDTTRDFSIIKKDINMYISSQNSLLLAQSLDKERILSDKIYNINLKDNEIIFSSEIKNPNRINLSLACFFDDNYSKRIRRIFVHKNYINIETNDNIISFINKEDNMIKKIKCIEKYDYIIFPIQNKLFIVNNDSTDISLRSIKLFDESYNIVSIDIHNDKLIICIRDNKDDRIRTYIKYMNINELLQV